MVPKQELYQRVAALSLRQRKLLTARLRQLKVDKLQEQSHESPPHPQSLVAYVVPHSNVSNLDTSKLRDYLKTKLPHYMIPAAIVPLETLPRNANGKIDTLALPEPQIAIAPPDISSRPRTPTEKSLAQIWQDVLGLDLVGIDDNFFELGGDSILSIQIVSKAREVGLQLAPNLLFEQPTIAELAKVVNSIPEVKATQTTVIGSVPLTPIQHWFFEQGMVAPHHWNQGILVELPLEVDRAQVEKAIATLWTHHDALRLSFSYDSTGWQQVDRDADKLPSLMQIDLSHLREPEQIKAIEENGSDLHASLNLAEGRLMRGIFFNRGVDRPCLLLISLHHLVVDAVSWQILVGDLAKLLLHQEKPVQLPAKTTSFKRWAEILSDRVKARQSEVNFWFDLVESPSLRLPRDYADPSTSTEATAKTVTVLLDETNTQALLQKVPATYNTQINDVLLTALAQTLLQWVDLPTGNIRLDLEAHGRESIEPDLDLSRTVGWLTVVYPVKLEIGDRHDSVAALKSIKEQLRQIKERGIDYGILRYLSDEPTRHRLSQAMSSEILFNYLGQPERSTVADRIKIVRDIPIGRLRNPDNRRNYLLEINAWIAGEKLQLNWIYDTKIYRSTTILELTNSYLNILKSLINQCNLSDFSGFTPSDFPDADLNQSELDEFITRLTQKN